MSTWRSLKVYATRTGSYNVLLRPREKSKVFLPVVNVHTEHFIRVINHITKNIQTRRCEANNKYKTQPMIHKNISKRGTTQIGWSCDFRPITEETGPIMDKTQACIRGFNPKCAYLMWYIYVKHENDRNSSNSIYFLT